MLKILKQGKVLVRFSAHKTRKSFLLNRLLGKQDGFSLGSTHERQRDEMRTLESQKEQKNPDHEETPQRHKEEMHKNQENWRGRLRTKTGSGGIW